MKRFEYIRAESLSEVLKILSEPKEPLFLLSGGTDLLIKMKKGVLEPAVLLDLKNAVDVSDRISMKSGSPSLEISIGARVVLADLAEDKRMIKNFPALVEAAERIGSVQIRNRATLTGNICNSSPAADTLSSLIAYGACVELAGQSGVRSLAVSDFLTGPGKNQRRKDEVVISITLPLSSSTRGSAFERLTRRKGVDLATVNTTCLIEPSGSAVFVFGAAGPVPVKAVDDSGILADPGRSDAEKKAVIKELVSSTSPISDVRATKEYRENMLQVLGFRSMKRALDRFLKEAS